MPWIDSIKPLPPVIADINVDSNTATQQIQIKLADIEQKKIIRKFAVYTFSTLENIDISTLPPTVIIADRKDTAGYRLPLSSLLQQKDLKKEFYIGLTAVDTNNQESELGILQKIQWSDERKRWEIVK